MRALCLLVALLTVGCGGISPEVRGMISIGAEVGISQGKAYAAKKCNTIADASLRALCMLGVELAGRGAEIGKARALQEMASAGCPVELGPKRAPGFKVPAATATDKPPVEIR